MTFAAASLALALLLSGAEPAEGADAGGDSPERAASRIAQCGAGPVEIRYDDILQAHVLTVKQATAEQLPCIDDAAGFHELEVPEALRQPLEAIRKAKFGPGVHAMMTDYLAGRGLLDKVPKFTEGATDEVAFSRQLETLCGPRAEGAFQSAYGPRVISPDWAGRMTLPPDERDGEALYCLMAAAIVAGFDFKLVGNEAMGAAE